MARTNAAGILGLVLPSLATLVLVLSPACSDESTAGGSAGAAVGGTGAVGGAGGGIGGVGATGAAVGGSSGHGGEGGSGGLGGGPAAPLSAYIVVGQFGYLTDSRHSENGNVG